MPWDNQKPIREELFSVERIEEHARSLAAAQGVTQKSPRGRPLAGRLAENAAVLFDSYRTMARAVDEGRAITPATEWLIDNYYLVEKQIHDIRFDLPAGYYRQLPKLAEGPFAGYPRVFGIVWAFVAHTDSRFDTEMFYRFVRAYQEVQILTIGELWALAITLRIVLIENLRRMAETMVRNRAARQSADDVADRLLGAEGSDAEPVSAVLAEYESGPLPEVFAVQLIYRLRDQDPKITPALAWLDQRLAAQQTTADMAVRDEHQRQGASSVTVRNIITSMRLISDIDWTELFERISHVDEVFATSRAFSTMDFPTRNLYRSIVEKLARGSNFTEIEIAHRAIAAAKDAIRADPNAPDERRGDPGYYLLGGGHRAFEAAIRFRPSWRARPKRFVRSCGIDGYAVAIVAVSLIVLALPLFFLARTGLGGLWLILLSVFGAVPAIDIAVALVNRGVIWGTGATPLPALRLRDGVPASLRTLVAVPTLLTTPDAITKQVEHLEVHYLANPEGDLHFALLSDWVDAATEHAEGDEALLATAKEGIEQLNRRHGSALGGRRFLLLHRKRVWNESEGRWIGWERKRGKLHELNRLLRGASDTTFLDIAGERPTVPADIRYVVTLDADTRLPRDTVRRLIGKMAHPLNRPRFNTVSGRIVEGYGVLQPRVTPSLPVGREGSLFQRTFSSMSGIDPYGSAVSDVYQDLFGEGSYAGKGIYDVDAFEAALAGRVPDSSLLSHDLFEGVFARAGLASDIEVVEEFPSRYDVASLRQHRWARGDWQLLPWILGYRKSTSKEVTRNAIPAIGRLKMLDNLRRTLSPPAAIVALLIGFTLPLQDALFWSLCILATIIVPTLIPAIGALMPRHEGITPHSHLRALGVDFGLAAMLSVLQITFLAHQAWLMSDAILRTLTRLFVTRRHLLQWVTAAQATIGVRLDLFGFYRRMAGAPVIGLLALAIAFLAGRAAWPLAAAFGALWIASPVIARRASQAPAIVRRLAISDADARALRLIARRTWRFFESFVTPADHMLPPDNFQEDPAPVLAHRTSPTNLGLYLLSAAAARDFGWIGTSTAVERLEVTFATMAGLERFRGHFYNWYDTRDLRPLDPRYISSVDSGNLAGHLIALANACREWRGLPLSDAKRLAGIADAIDLAREEADRLQDGHTLKTVTWHQLDRALAALSADADSAPIPGKDIMQRLTELGLKAEAMAAIAHSLAAERGDALGAGMLSWVDSIGHTIESHQRDFGPIADTASPLAARLTVLEKASRKIALGMEFGFLFDHERKLLSIGFLVPESKLDSNCYDLLASEARLASFFAIAKGDLPTSHWFRLGRTVTPVAYSAALISWSGSMFEYLMPLLVMREPAGSLLEQTSGLIVQRQIGYGAELGVPWGVSESAYNARDVEFTYQYSNFGVPGLGLKRGLGENVVVAPYATALATMVDPAAAALNFRRLANAGGRGHYGFYESLDYTPSRVPEGKSVAIVGAYMAHHQGMTIVAIADALLNGTMRTRFHAEPIIQATDLLLQERTPRDVATAHPWETETKSAARILGRESSAARRILTPHGATPATHLLSNGHYAVMLTAAGSGYSRWRDIAVTRWREDPTCDDSGSYIYLRDVHSGMTWTATYQPSGVEPDDYDVRFNEDRAEFTRRDGTLTTTVEVLVSAESAAEVRRVSIANNGKHTREIEITSYAELVLAPQTADIAHPAFSKLFVETEYLADLGVILATRRRRTPEEPQIWAAHLAVVDGEAVGLPEIETDRARFLGRGGNARTPAAMIGHRPLSNTTGTVLDPVFALRRRVRIAPGETVRVAFWTMVTSTRETVLTLTDQNRDITAFERAATLAWTQAQVQLYHLGIDQSEANLFQRLAGHLLYAAPTLRSSSDAIRRGGGGQPGLWPQGISGDLPIVLLRIADIESLNVAHQLLQGHEYWRMKQLAADIVILNEHPTSYMQDLQTALETLLRSSQSVPQVKVEGPTGRVFILRADLIPPETRSLLASIARVVLVGERGRLSDQLARAPESNAPIPPPHAPFSADTAPPHGAAPAPPPALEFFNGLGGFAKEGREYVTILGPGQSTPAPWINVIANPSFGFQVAAEGSGYTWSANSRENQITPWSNDPVTDRPGEAFFLRDTDTGDVWTPTAQPIRDRVATYTAHHGWGYSRFEHAAHGIDVELLQYVPLGDPIKISRLRLRNTSRRTRYISVTAYVEWVLGPSRTAAAPFVMTEIDPATRAMFARNPWKPDFGSQIAFADLNGRQTDWTGDRREFIGRNGTLASPAALARTAALSNTVGAGLDPCGALRTTIVLPPNGTAEIAFFLGEAANAEDARGLIDRYRKADLNAVLSAVQRHWHESLGAIQVKTPDRPLDIMLNGWLLYQTIACRLWARSAFYQSSGAYGFRDQLQDVMALAMTRPALTREHLLRAAARQFVEGDVQHWWLPHSGQGVRTRISDDRAWLAYVVAHYVATSGDDSVLDEAVPFLEGQKLKPGEADAFFLPAVSSETASLFEHCARGLDHSLALGIHGLPLIGTGDWNDGMNRVGENGRGESVWLGWLLHATLAAFAPLADARHENSRASTWRAHATGLRASLDREAWDGAWYLRGWFDNGATLGAAANQECRIDSIAQSWAVVSGAGDPDRANRAMSAVERELIRAEGKLAMLFTPPFDAATHDPGYIKAYPPGIRENGGQYNHAALWSVMALAGLGRGDDAARLLSFINPVNRSSTREDIDRYKAEPYVVAADIYTTAPHIGRGGWTWYSGSAGVMHRAGIENILGLRMQGAIIQLDPCIPKDWPRFEMTIRYRSASYAIRVENPAGVTRGILSAELDDKAISVRPLSLPLHDDGVIHRVLVRLG